MAGLFSLASFDRHVSARCISPSGSLLTTRVNMFLLTGEALTDASQALSSYSSAFDRFEVPSACVGRPTLVLRTEPQRQFGFSKPACMDSATTLVVPEPPGFRLVRGELGSAFRWIPRHMPCSVPLPELSPRVQRWCAACSDRRVQSRFSFQRWAPAPRGTTTTGSEPALWQ